MFRHLISCGLIASLGISSLCAQDYIWIEGEQPTNQSVTRHPWWYEKVKKDQLSGGDFIANYGDKVGEVSYAVDIAKTGQQDLWIRANPLGAALSYKIDDGEWQAIDMGTVRENTNIAEDDTPDMRFIGWVKVGPVQLKAGKRTISFRMHSGNNNHGMLDCFVLASGPFTPNGANKPGEKSGRVMDGYWAFEPDTDTFEHEAALDLRSLNEKVAGEKGWVAQDKQGHFLDGAHQEVRFWAANTGVQGNRDLKELTIHAKHLAKRGVNMVRHHGSLWPKNAGSAITDTDTDELDRIHMLVAAMKREGIYTTVSPYWAIPCQVQKSWGIEGQESGSPITLIFWDETVQRGYKAWIKDLLTSPNPYDDKQTPLGKDPAVAILQIQNEDSFLFWTTMQLKNNPVILARLNAKYATWLKAKDKSSPPQLNFNFWESENPSDNLKDSFHFMTELMYNWNAELERYVREDLHCPVLINAGNWHTADEVRLLDQERWSYTANDVVGVNKYVSGVHVNPSQVDKSGYLVAKGDYFTDGSKLLAPRGLATNIKQVAGKTFIIPESTWVAPMSHQSEAPFLVAAYSSLTGVDIYYWFALGQTGFDSTINKWQAANPTIMGGWPAAALIFRLGYIKESQPVVHEIRTLTDMWDLRSPIIAEDEAFDPNRMEGAFGKESNIQKGVDPMAFLVGKVEVTYSDKPGASTVIDLSPYVDADKKTVTSITGEIHLDHGQGLCTIDAPKAQGATGFLKQAGDIKLGDVTISANNEYATVFVVSLDNNPLKTSKRILLQITTMDRPYGWKTSPSQFKSKDGKHDFTGFRIDDTGGSPWNIIKSDLTITVANDKLSKATVLDANGYAKQDGALKLSKAKGGVSIRMPEDALYVIIER